MKRAFTLIELLVVLSIVALLSVVVFAALSGARVKARDAARIANARQIGIALEQYNTSAGSYRVANAGYLGGGGGFVAKGPETANYATSVLMALSTTGHYSSSNLRDPVYATDNYYLGLCNGGAGYNIYLKVEQQSLQQSSSTISGGCDGASAASLGFNYVLPLGSALASSIGTSSLLDYLTGNPVYAQSAAAGNVAYYTDSTHLTGSTGLNWDGSTFGVAGTIQSSVGGVKFPDGTVQVTSGTGKQVYVAYAQSTAQAVPAGTGFTINFNQALSDARSTVTTGSAWKFTAPISGIYHISAAYATANYDFSKAQASVWLQLAKNGALSRQIGGGYVPTTSGVSAWASGGTVIDLNAGDTLSLTGTIFYVASGGSPQTHANSGDCWVTIERVSDLP